VVGEECLANFAQTEGLPDPPLWCLADAEKPCRGPAADIADMAFDAEVAAAPREAFPRSHRAAITAETPTLLIFTSGTTGLPKAACYSHMRWLSSGDVMEVTVEATPDDVFYCFLPLPRRCRHLRHVHRAAGWRGHRLRRKFSTREFWKDVRSHGITVCQYIGEICRYLLNQPASPDDRQHGLRCMMGAGLTPEIWQRWIERFGSVQIFEGWGSTEANTALINVDNRIGSCGRVPYWEKTNFRLVRYDVESDTHPRDDRVSTCCASRAKWARGWATSSTTRRSAAAASRATPRPRPPRRRSCAMSSRGDAFWSSGDLLRYDEDGYFYFVDRIGDTFRWKSENVSTQEVADALSDCPGVELINIYGVQVPQHEGRAGMAAIVMQPGQAFDPAGFYALTEAPAPLCGAPVRARLPRGRHDRLVQAAQGGPAAPGLRPGGLRRPALCAG
jgi:fatty-acyl-CoA synthase